MGYLKEVTKQNNKVVKVTPFSKFKTITMQEGINNFCNIVRSDNPDISRDLLNDSLCVGVYYFTKSKGSVELIHSSVK